MEALNKEGVLLTMSNNRLWRVCPRTGKRFFSPSGPWCLWLLPIVGLVSLIWFLVRVVPKPSRAMYPCQRIAVPLASGFVIWLMGTFVSALAFRKARHLLVRSRLVLATICLLIGLGGAWLAVTYIQENPIIAEDLPFEPSDAPLSPMGQGRGIHPGRVVWVRDTDATSWNGSGSTRWHYDSNTDQTVVNEMVSRAICQLAGTTSEEVAWEEIFRNFNLNKEGLDIGYLPGEKIAIKINQVEAWISINWSGNLPTTSPQVLYALLKQLIDVVGVNPSDIICYDASRVVTNTIYNKCSPLGVRFAGCRVGPGREAAIEDDDEPILFSNDPVNDYLALPGGTSVYNGAYYAPTFVTEAKYFINFSDMKGHSFCGVTLTAKNLFGSVWNPMSGGDTGHWSPGGDGGIHKFIRTQQPPGSWLNDLPPRPYDTYNVLVDLLGYRHFGGKTLLYFSTALYVGMNFSDTPYKWGSFDDEWPASIFVSQDPVAIDSVCVDFFLNEPTTVYLKGDVDNYLHEAAQADDPPSGTFYDPNRDGVGLSSLGAHEHWNNGTDKQYSHNLGGSEGIELLRVRSDTVVGRRVFYNNSAWDGNDPAANASDDDAIATDKSPLFEGDAATFANYTSYSRGINGIMVDVADAVLTPSASDFVFKAGSDSDPAATWTNAPAPTSITVRPGAGVGGSDRVTIIWADSAIANQWLQVTYTPAADVFYYGNAIGDTGDSIDDAEVTPTDEIAVRDSATSLGTGAALITDAADFNRDKKIGPTDAIIIRNNGTNSITAVPLISFVFNPAPIVNAGNDIFLAVTETANLHGTVDDALTSTWLKVSGPGTVTFGDASALDTTATFSAVGSYELRLLANDGEKNGADNILVKAEGAYLEDDFDDNNLDGWTTLAGAFVTTQYLTGPGYEVHATSSNSRMKADLPDTELADTVYISFKLRHTGVSGGSPNWKGGQIFFVDDSGSGFGLYFILDTNGPGILDLYLTTDNGATKTFIDDPSPGSFSSPPAPGGDGLKEVKLVYNRVDDQIQCFYEGSSMGVIDMDPVYRNFTGVVLSIIDVFFTGDSGGLGMDDIYVGNLPAN